MTRLIQRFCDGVDAIAGILLMLCTSLIVVSAFGRYALSWPVPDSFDVSRYLIGACMAWGYASLGYRGGHIAVDLFYEPLGPRGRKALVLIGWVLLLIFTVLLAYMMFFRLRSAYLSNEATFDLQIPVWPFIGLIWTGIVASVITTVIAFNREPDEPNPLEGHGA
jgi:TRAP-type C4-dicarboxylate transport system permease small subunit